MPIITTSKCKVYLGIIDTAEDERIDALIPECEADYLKIRGAAFNTLSGEILYPRGSELVTSRMVGYLMYSTPGLASENVGNISQTRSELLNGYPIDIVGGIIRYQDIL